MQGAVELGLLYALMALGVYITFRILNFPDLTVDGSFTTGGAIAAVMIAAGYSPWLATLAALIGGLIAGALTGLLHTARTSRCSTPTRCSPASRRFR
jgi:putative ABC transport system permease protein